MDRKILLIEGGSVDVEYSLAQERTLLTVTDEDGVVVQVLLDEEETAKFIDHLH